MRIPRSLSTAAIAVVLILAAPAVATGAAPTRALESVSFSDSQNGLAVGWVGNLNGLALSTSDGGQSWSVLRFEPNTGYRTAWRMSGSTALILKSYGRSLLRTTDGGSSWAPSVEIQAPGGFDWRDIVMTDETTGWIVGAHLYDGQPATIYGTTDGGRTWAVQFRGPFHSAPPDQDPPSTRAILCAVDVVPGTKTAWAVGSQLMPSDYKSTSSLVYRTTDGTAWSAQTMSGGRELMDVCAISAQTAIAISKDGYVCKTTNGGATWTQTRPSSLPVGTSSLPYLSMSFPNSTTGWVVGGGGRIYKTVNGGTSWAQQSSGTAEKLRSVTFVDTQHGWAVGDNETILRTQDGGATWTKVRTYVAPRITLGTSASTVAYGGSARLAGAVTGISGVTLTLQQMPFGSASWAFLRSLTPATGYAHTVGPIYSKTSYRLVYEDPTGYQTTASGSVAVTPRAYVTVPTAPSSTVRGRAFTSAGYLKPRHTAGAYSVRLYCYRYESGRWVLRKTAWARNADYSSFTRYSASVNLPYTGRWRIRAYHADSGHAATWTGYRYVYVNPPPRAYLTVPYAPSAVRRGLAFTAAGYLKPRHTAGAYSVKLYCYRYERGRWVLRRTAWARNANYYSYTRYSARLSLPYTGRWRIRAYHADTGHSATWTGYRYVTVR